MNKKVCINEAKIIDSKGNPAYPIYTWFEYEFTNIYKLYVD